MDEKQALAIADQFVVNGQAKTPDRAAALQGETTYTMIQKAIDKVVMDNARKASQPTTAAATPVAASTATATTSATVATATTLPSRTVDINFNGEKLGSMQLDALSDQVLEKFMTRLEEANRRLGR